MSILYIIGNGLDLHHGLRTAPQDFRNILKTKRIYNEWSNAYDILDSYCVNWSEYEESLSDLDLDEIECQNLIMPDYLSDHEYDRDGGITNIQMYLESLNDAIQSSLKDMVKIANIDTERRALLGECYPLFNLEDRVLSFNYTSTLENMFDFARHIPICHIHGFYDTGESLIFGYNQSKGNYGNKLNSTFEDGDYYVDQQRELIYNFYQSWQKSIQIKCLNDFLSCCAGIDEVVVYGHAMGKVDAVYMEQIERVLNPRRWRISYHTDSDSVLFNAQQYPFKSKFNFFRW